MSSRSPIVAIVDDDIIFQLTASRIIESLEVAGKILQFNNGEEALKFLAENANKKEELPDYIFLDINMPFVDGWMFLQDYATMKGGLSRDICIYMVSSSIDDRDLQRARNIPDVSEYVVKPVEREKFRDLLA